MQNISLFIKRAELHQNEEYIRNIFAQKNIGVVDTLNFIKKHSENGKEYNGVIVTFKYWFSNDYTKSLINQLTTKTNDGLVKLFIEKSVYWYVSIHQKKMEINKCDELQKIDANLSDKDKIKQLELLVNNLSTQLYYMQKKQETNEQMLMTNECKNMKHHIYNVELEHSILEINILNEELKEENELLKKENEQLMKNNNALNEYIGYKNEEIVMLKQETNDLYLMNNYNENMIEELQNKLNEL